ncbi:hypothetical protein SAMN05880582_101723 [Rhizobium sp. RU20A]|uniref:hypothetical protein n=1 Tax=Rhizobium sp. RU20A TaxID=1907412 RepID=UPI000955A87B|nr:hypothetical protein [Rhizobium sp. RU20A]SIQ09888.1 hypothetical protein SAMN05880582_101723 [Rhizobium sp. RU20A]
MNSLGPSFFTGSAAIRLDDPAVIAAHPGFPRELQAIGQALTAIHDRAPQMVRYMASMQRWLLTQSLFALHLARDPGEPLTGITAARLQEIAIRTGAASRNTAAAHLAELIAHKMVSDVPDPGTKRSRPLVLTAESEAAMRLWFRAHIASLDRLDGKERVRAFDARPDALFTAAHQRAAAKLIADPAWHTPPPAVGAFVWTDCGSNVLHDLFSSLPATVAPTAGRVPLGPYALSALAERYRLSLTSVRRLFHKAEKLGVLSWEGATRNRRLWISKDFIDEHAGWQAVKFAAIAEAFDGATGSAGT